MMKINVVAKTEKGIDAIQKHLSEMKLKDRFWFKRLGIKQTYDVKTATLEITWENIGLKVLDKFTPKEMKQLDIKKQYFYDKHLIPAMKKNGAIENIDYVIK